MTLCCATVNPGLLVIADYTYDPRQIVRKGLSVNFWGYFVLQLK